jgi:hypothetical protein
MNNNITKNNDLRAHCCLKTVNRHMDRPIRCSSLTLQHNENQSECGKMQIHLSSDELFE